MPVRATLTEDEEKVLGVNDRAQLAQANAVVRQRKITQLLQSGVTIVDPSTTYIEPEVEIEPDTTILPGCHLRGQTLIARDCEIGPNSYVIDTEIGAGSRVWYSVLEGARVGERVAIGPFSHLRPGAVVDDDATLGNYAEVKASRIGSGTQMHHFSYVGDAEIGATSAHCGAGRSPSASTRKRASKSRTVVGDDADDQQRHAAGPRPVEMKCRRNDEAPGTVVTHDIPAGDVWVGAPGAASAASVGGYPPGWPTLKVTRGVSDSRAFSIFVVADGRDLFPGRDGTGLAGLYRPCPPAAHARRGHAACARACAPARRADQHALDDPGGVHAGAVRGGGGYMKLVRPRPVVRRRAMGGCRAAALIAIAGAAAGPVPGSRRGGVPAGANRADLCAAGRASGTAAVHRRAAPVEPRSTPGCAALASAGRAGSTPAVKRKIACDGWSR